MLHAIPGFALAPRAAWAATLLLLLTAATSAAAPAVAQAPPRPSGGRIEGRVLDMDGKPVSWADVAIAALGRGTATDDVGRFVLEQIPSGSWRIQVRLPGLQPLEREVVVTAGAATRADFRFQQERVFTMPDVEVHDSHRLDLDGTDKRRRMGATDLADARVTDFEEAVGRVAGVVVTADGLHARGGRVTDNQVQVSGIPSGNALTDAGPRVALLAIGSLDVVTGGMNAEDGGALSAVIKLETREGGKRFGGSVRWDTDRFGDPEKTFDLYDRLTFGAGGPTPIAGLTWFGVYEGSYSNTALPSGVSRSRHTVLDFMSFGDRQQNDVNASLKLAWKPGGRDKFTFEMLDHRSLDTPYDHMWSRAGWVQVGWDTVAGRNGAPPALAPRYGSWSPVPVDSTWLPAKLADHVPTLDDRFRQMTGVWIRTFGTHSVWTSRASRFAYQSLRSIGQKEPWEYETQNPFYWSGNLAPGTENNPYFATHGDLPVYSRRRTASWVGKSDFASRRWNHHRWKAGVEAAYHEIENLSLLAPNLESSGLPGGQRSSFRNFHPEGSAFVQDRWEFEGMVLNVGLRADAFTPGEQIADDELPSGRRFKQQVSPRIGVAYPVSDRDALSFHYGWTYQTPPRAYVFEERGPLSSVPVRGNPDLAPETNVSFQAALQHLFARDVSGQFAVFFRDIYGLVTSRTERDANGNLIPRYVNEDYASARGFEASISKGFSHHFSAEVDYTFQIATGVASDPNSALAFYNGGRLYLPISEQPLDWDQRQTLNLQAVVREPGRWGLHLAWEVGSGLPFTPQFRNDRRADPVLANARRRPMRASLNLDGDKFYKVWGVPLTFSFEARNALDAKIIRSLSPGAIANPNINLSGGDDYTTYYTETGRAGGAYLQDRNGDGTLDWVPLRDPRVFEEGRRVRVGVSASF